MYRGHYGQIETVEWHFRKWLINLFVFFTQYEDDYNNFNDWNYYTTQGSMQFVLWYDIPLLIVDVETNIQEVLHHHVTDKMIVGADLPEDYSGFQSIHNWSPSIIHGRYFLFTSSAILVTTCRVHCIYV
jgi:hypothetical protein